jgi:hypothetical protein
MSSGKDRHLLSNSEEDDVSETPQDRLGPLDPSDDRSVARTVTLHDVGDPSDPDPSVKRPRPLDALGNPGSRGPDSSQTSIGSPFKNPSPRSDVEAQPLTLPEAPMRRCSNCCPQWCNEIHFQRWYEWVAYYIPILEWLPQYKCALPICKELISFSSLHFPRFACWIDIGEYFNSYVSFIRCVYTSRCTSLTSVTLLKSVPSTVCMPLSQLLSSMPFLAKQGVLPFYRRQL